MTEPGLLPHCLDLWARGARDQSRALLQGHLEADPDDAAAWALYGRLLLEIGEVAVARIALEEALALEPADLGSACVLAEVERRQGQMGAGLARLGAILADHPGHAEALRLARAIILQHASQGEGAPLPTIPPEQETLFALACAEAGRSLGEAHNRQEAIVAFRLAAWAMPDDYNRSNDLACALLRSLPVMDGTEENFSEVRGVPSLRVMREALRAFLHCIELAPESALAYKNLGSLMTYLASRKVFDAEGAAAYSQIRAFQLDTGDQEQRLLAASLLFDLKQLEASAALYSGENIIPGDDEEEDGGRWRLDVFVKGFTEGLEKIEEQILMSVDPARRADALIRIGDILVGLGMEGEAVLFFALALQDVPDNEYCREAVRAAMAARRLLHEAIAVSTGDRSILPPPLVMV